MEISAKELIAQTPPISFLLNLYLSVNNIPVIVLATLARAIQLKVEKLSLPNLYLHRIVLNDSSSFYPHFLNITRCENTCVIFSFRMFLFSTHTSFAAANNM